MYIGNKILFVVVSKHYITFVLNVITFLKLWNVNLLTQLCCILLKNCLKHDKPSECVFLAFKSPNTCIWLLLLIFFCSFVGPCTIPQLTFVVVFKNFYLKRHVHCTIKYIFEYAQNIFNNNIISIMRKGKAFGKVTGKTCNM